ncbi:HEPN domain-containing protein [Arthrobacter pityocampae]|uniref:HEPN domain-containing protein n=1 Tax=Arthrobacter pityocampae TaxID=547334 RepID=UPI00142E1047|nr:HEPN domain-containing protein [Arthrobacter pityocampae]
MTNAIASSYGPQKLSTCPRPNEGLLSIPRGKKFVGQASLARIDFHEASDDIRSYFTLRQMLKDRKGAAPHLTNVGRGTFVLISALWEAYCEAVAVEAAALLVTHTQEAEQLPVHMRRSIASELREAKHELSIWEIAGEGWKSYALSRIATLARTTVFNTPKPTNVADLFKRSLGIENLPAHWTPPESLPDSDPQALLKHFVEIRGAIAHGASPRREVTKAEISDFYQTVSSLVADTDSVIRAHLLNLIGRDPWPSEVMKADLREAQA